MGIILIFSSFMPGPFLGGVPIYSTFVEQTFKCFGMGSAPIYMFSIQNIEVWCPLIPLEVSVKGTRRLMRVSACSQTATSMPGSVSDRDSLVDVSLDVQTWTFTATSIPLILLELSVNNTQESHTQHTARD